MSRRNLFALMNVLVAIALILPAGTVSAQVNDPISLSANQPTIDSPAVPAQVTAAVVTKYSVQDLGTLAGGSSYARAVNLSGTVTGWSDTGAGNAYEHAFKWQSGVLDPLPVLGGNPDLSAGYSLNTAGLVVGYSSSSGTTSRAVSWSGTNAPTDLGTLGGRNAAALHINDQGQIVGWAEFDPDSGARRAVIWSSGGISPLTAGGNFDEALSINNAGKAVGECITLSTPMMTKPCAWPGGVLAVLAVLGGSQGSARDINEAGTIAGWAETADLDHHGGHIPHAAIWDSGGVHDLGPLPGNKVSRANAINALGQVVGAASIISEFSSSPSHAVLWENGQIYDLNDRLPAGTGWVLTEAYGINDAGQIIGVGGHDGVYYRAFLLTPATQPVVTLEGSGLGLVGQTYTYTATSNPAGLEQPINYTWTTTNQSPFNESGGLTSTQAYSWTQTGSQEISVSATSALDAEGMALLPVDIGDVLVAPTTGNPAEIAYTFAPERAVTITIPANAVADGTELLFTALPQPSDSAAFSFTGIAFELGAYVDGLRQPGFVFTQPVTVAMTFTTGDLAGLDESKIKLYYQVGSVWVDAASTCAPLSQYVRDLVHHQLSVEVCHLSTFAAGVFDGTQLFLPVIMSH